MSDNIREQLNTEDKDFLNKVAGELEQNEDKLHRTCNFVVNKVGRQTVTNFKSLEPADKLQACLDHLAISLVAGHVTKDEIGEIMQDQPHKKGKK